MVTFTHLVDDLALDSLGLVLLALELELEGVTLPDELLMTLETVDDLVHYVERHLWESSA